MPKPENIKPHQYKKGQSGNPAGKPKGTLNFTTILRELLEEEVTDDNGLKIPKGKLALIEWLNAALIGRDVLDKDGNKISNIKDWKAIQAILERIEGKPTEKVELTGRDGEDLTLKIEPSQLKALSESWNQTKAKDNEKT